MDRTPIREAANYLLRLREPLSNNAEGRYYMDDHLVLCRADTGEIVATIRRQDLFDKRGNRFDFGA